MIVENKDYTIIPLLATDMDCYNAIINAIQCRNFEIYCQYHKEEFANIFHKVTYKGKLLSKSFQTLTIIELRDCFNYVLDVRSKELILEEDIKITEFTQLQEYQQMIISLVYHFGDKLGGLRGIDSLSPVEVAQWYSWLSSVSQHSNKLLNDEMEKSIDENRKRNSRS